MKMMAPILALLLACGSGCMTLEEEQLESARQRTEIQNQRTEVDQFRARVEALEKQIEDVRVRADAAVADNERMRRDVREGLAGMDRAIRSLEAAREADKQAIINDLTAKITRIGEVMQSRGGVTSSANSPSGGSGSATGGAREHVVQAGETLSSIASTYKVKAAAIIEANGMKNPNSLKVGRKLVIPE